MTREECIQFTNKAGVVLRGILHHHNSQNHRGLSVICLNTGLNDMVGWHRIQVKMARYLAGGGYNVLRFDDSGLGDSDGEINEESIVKIFAEIERGLFVENADSAVEFMADRFRGDLLVYLGLCGGGLTALHSAARNKRLAGLIDVGGPVTLSSREYLEKKDPWEVQKNVKRYRSKLFDPGAWWRFFSGKGEYSTALKSAVFYLKHRFRGAYKAYSPEESEDPRVASLNREFFHSFEACARRKVPMLFYFAETDSATWEFKKYFFEKYKGRELWLSGNNTFIEVEKANHIFSDQTSQERLKQDVSRWLESL